jgi:hypothetical protein
MSIARVNGCLLEPETSLRSSESSGAEKPARSGRLPNSIDYSNQLLPVRDQGSSDKCVAYAVCGLKEHQDNTGAYLDVDDLYESRKSPKGSGMYVTDALDILVRQGVAPHRPDHMIKIWWQDFPPRDSIIGVKQALVYRGVLVASFPCNNDAPDEKFWKTQSTSSGHSVAIVGYDDTRAAFKLRNSWGKGYGDNGYAWISYTDFSTYCRAAYSTTDLDGKHNPVVVKDGCCILM